MAHPLRNIFYARTGPQAPALPKATRFHNYAHTKAYLLKSDRSEDGYNHKLVYYEAKDNPVTGKWTVRRCTALGNRETKIPSQDELGGLRVRDLKGSYMQVDKVIAENLSPAHALECLALLEEDIRGKSQEGGGISLWDNHDRTHYTQVALDEGIALDINGKAHPTFQGRIVTSGTFSTDLKEKLKRSFNENSSDHKSGTQQDRGLIDKIIFPPRLHASQLHIDKADAATSENWKAAYRHLSDALSSLIYMQAHDFPKAKVEKGRILVRHDETILQEDAFFDHLKKAEDYLSYPNAGATVFGMADGRVVKNNQRENLVCYIQLMRFTYYLSLAKHRLKQFKVAENKEERNAYRRLLKETTEKIYDHLGLSSLDNNLSRPSENPYGMDILDIQAEIVSMPAKTLINKALTKLDKYHALRDIDCYFMPEELADFVENVAHIRDEIEKKVQKALEAEKKRKLELLDQSIHKYANAYIKKYKNADRDYSMPAEAWYAIHLRGNSSFTDKEILKLLNTYKASDDLNFNNYEVASVYQTLCNKSDKKNLHLSGYKPQF